MHKSAMKSPVSSDLISLYNSCVQFKPSTVLAITNNCLSGYILKSHFPIVLTIVAIREPWMGPGPSETSESQIAGDTSPEQGCMARCNYEQARDDNDIPGR